MSVINIYSSDALYKKEQTLHPATTRVQITVYPDGSLMQIFAQLQTLARLL